MGFQVDIDMKKIEEREKIIGRKYSFWTDQEKLNFVFDNLVFGMDQYVIENGTPLSDEFEERIQYLSNCGFEVGYRNEFFNICDRVPAKEAILYNKENGMVHYIEAHQVGNGPYGYDIYRSNLMFQTKNQTYQGLKQKLEECLGSDDWWAAGYTIADEKFVIAEVWRPSSENIAKIMNMEFEFQPVWNLSFGGNEFLNSDELRVENRELKQLVDEKLEKLPVDAQKIICKKLV